MSEENSKWLVIVNPKASIGKAGKDWPQIKQALEKENINFDFIITEYQGHAIDLVRDNITEKGYRNIISVGGDGTNNEIINGIFTQQRFPTESINMGIIPIGTGNDWRRAFGFSLDYHENAKILKAKNLFVHDIGKVTYYNDNNPKVRYFLNAAGTGLDHMVCESTNLLKQQGKGGSARYLGSVVKSLIKYKGDRVHITIDGKTVFDDEILNLSLGNCAFNGGGMMTMRGAIPNDGLLDVTVIRKVSMVKFAANVKSLYDGSFIDKFDEVETYKGKHIRVASIPPHALKLETEGENLTNSPFDFEILPKAINMVIPEKAMGLWP